MKCPRDNTELVQATLGVQTCYHCLACKGYFLRLTESIAGGVDLRKLNPRAVAKRFCQAGETLTSPASGLAMLYFEHNGIKLDFCESTNSIWMDHGEFEQIIKQLRPKIDKEEAKSESVILDVVGEGAGVIEFIGDAVFGLFDGF